MVEGKSEHEKNSALDNINTEDNLSIDYGALCPEPSEEDIAILRKVSGRLPISAWLVSIVELSERFTYYGISGVFQNYMQLPRDNKSQPGALGLGQQTATALSYFFQFWCYVTPILGAVIADTYYGRFKTISIFAIVYVIGILVLFLTSLPTSIDHGAAYGGLIAAMIIIGLGTGGIKSNVSPLIADQYRSSRPYVKTTKSGERVIVDPTLPTNQSI